MATQTEEVKAGRELDAEVARRVMRLYDVRVTPSGSLCHDPGQYFCVNHRHLQGRTDYPG